MKRCEKCGESELPFEVDHIDASTKVDHRIWSWSNARREAELAKCQLLCEQCHWNKTAKENSREPSSHGTRARYKICKCTECTKANTEYIRSWRK